MFCFCHEKTSGAAPSEISWDVPEQMLRKHISLCVLVFPADFASIQWLVFPMDFTGSGAHYKSVVVHSSMFTHVQLVLQEEEEW